MKSSNQAGSTGSDDDQVSLHLALLSFRTRRICHGIVWTNYGFRRLIVEPPDYISVGLRAHKPREHLGVEDDHSPNWGSTGCPRSCSMSVSTPTPRKRAAIVDPRLAGP